MTPRTRHRIGLAALAIAVLSAAATVYIILVGGFSLALAGATITSHDPWRPGVLALLALIVSARMGIASIFRGGWPAIPSAPTAVLLAAAVTAIGIAYSTTTAGGSDAYGYVSQAELWTKGLPRIEQPWTRDVPWPLGFMSFSTLGYRANEDKTALVPTYASGLPILMSIAKRIGGQEAMFWIVPISGGILVLTTFGIGRRLGSPGAGLVGAWLVATSPPFLFMLVWPMTDVPVAAAWAVTFYALFGTSMGSLVASGVATGLAILIRPNLAPLAIVPIGWLVFDTIRTSATLRRDRMRRFAAFVVGLTPLLVVLAYINSQLYGGPLRSGYGSADAFFALDHVLPNLKRYPLWFAQYHTPLALAGVIALLLPIARLWTDARDRLFVVVCLLFSGALFAEYCLFMVFDAWWYQRFLLACLPFIMAGVGVIAAWLVKSRGMVVRVVTIAAIVTMGARGFRLAAQESAFELWQGERRYTSVAKLVRAKTDPNSVTIAGQHSGSVRYYGGRMTMRFDWMDAAWLDRTVAWLSGHGVHPYLLIEDWELAGIAERFKGQQTLAILSAPPVFEYLGGARVLLYDLLAPRETGSQHDIYNETYQGNRSVPPVAPPALSFRTPAGH